MGAQRHMRKWRAWSLPLSPLGRLLLKLFREAHLGGPLSRSSKDDAEVGGEGKSHLFPMGQAKVQVCRVCENKPSGKCFQSIGEGGQKEFQGTAAGWKLAMVKPGTRVTRGWVLGPDPWLTFPWELGTVTDGHGSHWHYDQSTLQSILSAEGCVTGPCPSQCMATEQVAFGRASTEDATSNTQPLPPIFLPQDPLLS